jgi:hypothetical protein
MLEAKCKWCGETFTPMDEDDLTHLFMDNGVVCDGPGEITGSWGGSVDAIKRQLHPSQSNPGASRKNQKIADAPDHASLPHKLPRDFPE